MRKSAPQRVAAVSARGESHEHPLPPLGVVLGRGRHESDAELAAMIRSDGRRRRASGERLSLSDYLRAIPDLRTRPLALDSAISASIGLGCSNSADRLQAAKIERARHADLAPAIDLAMCLDQLVGPLKNLPEQTALVEEPFAPFDLGSNIEDGQPRYRAVSMLGCGATSTVYLAEDRLFSSAAGPTRVAIKVFERDPAHAESFDRIVDEARKARSVEHPHVVRVLDVGWDSRRIFIVQEHLRGVTLDAWLCGAGGPPSLRRAVEVMRQVAAAMDAVHAAGIVHGDLKPTNILITPSGVAKVIDFGASEGFDREGEGSKRRTGQDQGGTLAFMSPERFSHGVGAGAPATDIYSLGAILHYACYGESPNGRSTLEALAFLSDAGRAGLASARADAALAKRVPRTLQRIIRRALAPKPSNRYSSAGLLAADLEAWAQRRPILWQRPGPLRRMLLLAARQPMGFSLTCVCAMLLIVGAALRSQAVESAHLARESEHAAELERTKLEAATSWRKKSSEQLALMLSKFKSAKNQGLEAEVMTSLWILEWVHGPMLLESPESLEQLWGARVEVLERSLKDLRARGCGESIEAHLLAPSLALWYIQSGRAAEAEELLGSCESFWAARTSTSDPWIEQIRLLRCAARVSALTLARNSGAAESRAERAHAASDDLATLKVVMKRDHESGKTGPMAQLVRRVVTSAEAAKLGLP